MIVTIEYTAQLKQAANCSAEEISLEAGTPAHAALLQVAQQHGGKLQAMLMSEGDNISATILFFINDTQVIDLASYQLSEGDRITVMSPISGG